MTDQNKGDEVNKEFKSKFQSDAEKSKDKLNAVSPTLCLAKWKQTSLHLTTGHTNSCYHPPLHKISVSDIIQSPSALHNTSFKKIERLQMLTGHRPEGCNYCWNMEDNGNLSDRHYRSGESWAAESFDKIVTAPWEQDVTPSYVEVNFNSVCNLKCSYCSPQFSSSWMDETKRHGAWPTSTPHNALEYFQGEKKPIPNSETNPYVEAFWNWWPTLYPELQHFRMTGGEPLLDKNTYRVFDYVLANPKPNLHLNVTSNFSVDEKSWQKYLSYVKQLCSNNNIEHFMQYVSLDSIGPQAEYIRNGLDFDLLWDRVNQFLTEIPSKNSITFIVTMNNLSVTGLGSLFAAILGLRKVYSHTYQRVWFDTPVLRTPSWQSLQILPESYIEKLEMVWAWMLPQLETQETRFKGFKDYELDRLDRDINWMKGGKLLSNEQLKKHRGDFYRFFSEHDRRRNTNFELTFPEMIEWWNECKAHAK